MSDTELNRSLWDERALLHGHDGYYDVEGFRAGGSSLSDREVEEVRAAVGDVEGLDLLHMQCHFGLDTLSFARMGARVTGLDSSPAAIGRARQLATETGFDATFVESDPSICRPTSRTASTLYSPRTECCAGSPMSARGCDQRIPHCGQVADSSSSICTRCCR